MRATLEKTGAEVEPSPESPGTATWDTLSVLLVEDEAAACDVLQQVLRRHRCHTTTCTRVDQAIELAHSHNFDIVLIDALAPGMSGLKAVNSLHRAMPKAVLVMLASYPDPDLVDRSLSEAALISLCKSLSAADLAGLIGEISRRR